MLLSNLIGGLSWHIVLHCFTAGVEPGSTFFFATQVCFLAGTSVSTTRCINTVTEGCFFMQCQC